MIGAENADSSGESIVPLSIPEEQKQNVRIKNGLEMPNEEDKRLGFYDTLQTMCRQPLNFVLRSFDQEAQTEKVELAARHKSLC